MTTGQPTEQHDGHRCAACGHPVWPGDAYCTGCGTPLSPDTVRRPLFADEVEGAPATRVAPTPEPAPEPAPEPVAGPPRRRRRGPWVVAVLVLLAAATGIGYAVGHRGEDAASPSGRHSPTAGGTGTGTTDTPSSAPSSSSAPPPVQPQDALQQVSRRDDARVRRLVGSWVPQLAALTPGAGGDASWSDALTHYRRLVAEYPSALLLDTGRWPHSYERGGMYAVVVPHPGRTSKPALAWCRAHVPTTPQDCAAKQIATSGSWTDNFDTGRPGPD